MQCFGCSNCNGRIPPPFPIVLKCIKKSWKYKAIIVIKSRKSKARNPNKSRNYSYLPTSPLRGGGGQALRGMMPRGIHKTTDKLSTGGASPSAKSKKREGRKHCLGYSNWSLLLWSWWGGKIGCEDCWIGGGLRRNIPEGRATQRSWGTGRRLRAMLSFLSACFWRGERGGDEGLRERRNAQRPVLQGIRGVVPTGFQSRL